MWLYLSVTQWDDDKCMLEQSNSKITSERPNEGFIFQHKGIFWKNKKGGMLKDAGEGFKKLS